MPDFSKAPGRRPDKPFHFNTSENLLRIGKQKANNISQLLQTAVAAAFPTPRGGEISSR